MKRVHCNKDKYTVYAGRPAKGKDWGFGNPWVIGKDGSREEVISNYREWLMNNNSRNHPDATERRREDILIDLFQLKPTDIFGCWCQDNEDCHCDILIEIYNETV